MFLLSLSFSHTEVSLQSRPLPDIPDSLSHMSHAHSHSGGSLDERESSGQGLLGFFPIEGSLRWISKENLLQSVQQEEPDPQLFVALYEFQSGGENQLSLRKGERENRLNRFALSFSHF